MPETLILTPNQKIEEFISKISKTSIDAYSTYWKTITPISHEEYYKRFQFAFLSVHTSWKANVRAYAGINKEQLTEKQQLMNLITVSGVGLNKMRTEGMWKFKQDFWANPDEWYKKKDEAWPDFRDRIMGNLYGLGYAKTSFAIELCYPNECEVTCLDTHMLQMYGVKSSPVPSPSKYKELEKHWIDKCKEKQFPSFMVRNVYWDKVQNQKDTRYWSHVFEK